LTGYWRAEARLRVATKMRKWSVAKLKIVRELKKAAKVEGEV
jgi:hypothetical protein